MPNSIGSCAQEILNACVQNRISKQRGESDGEAEAHSEAEVQGVFGGGGVGAGGSQARLQPTEALVCIGRTAARLGEGDERELSDVGYGYSMERALVMGARLFSLVSFRRQTDQTRLTS